MKIIGLTGGVGSGKSRILYELSHKYDAFVVEADKLAHELMLPEMEIYNKAVEYFGDEILDNNAEIDRKKLGDIVFKSSDKLDILNSIVHPAVKNEILRLIEKKRAEGNCKYFVIEAALLIQDGYKSICDEIWTVYVPAEERMARLKQQRGYTDAKCIEIMSSQPDEEYYRINSDVILDNSKGFEAVSKTIEGMLLK